MKSVVESADSSPQNAITVEMRSMFAAYPSAVLFISRHGVSGQNMFARVELVRIAKAILAMDQRIEQGED